MKYNKIILNTSKFYNKTLLRHGSNSKGLGWSSKKLQYLRFKELVRFFNIKNSSIHDVGCGNGEMYIFLKNKGIKKYFGSDISEIMIDKSKKRFEKVKNVQFKKLNIYKDLKKIPKYDFTVASGIFNIKNNFSNKLWSEYYYDSIFKMFIKSKKGLSFNILNFDCEYKNPKNFYPKLEKTLSFIRKDMTKKILINNTYDLWEYTIFLYKK